NVHGSPPRLARRWLDRLQRSGTAVSRSTSVVYVRRVGERYLLTAQSLTKTLNIVSRTLMLATGAGELFLPLDGWPGRHVFCIAFDLVPNTELARLAGCRLERGAVAVDGWQATTVPGIYAAGEPTGIGGVHLSLVEGEIAGAAAAGQVVPSRLTARRKRL